VGLSISADRVDRLSEVLLDAGAQSLTFADAGDTPVLEPGPGETPLWPLVDVAALFALDTDVGALRSALVNELGGAVEVRGLDVEFVAATDWSQTWRQFAIDHRFGGRLWVVPRDAPDTPREGVVLRLDPGLAFGTGAHATTALCLDWLARARRTGATVVDYGAGSGILGIAALLLGARAVIAVDHDPQARLATLENATYNGVAAQQLSVVAPDALSCTPRDLVLANILAEPLVTLAPVLSGLTRPGGTLVMSGMLAHQLDGVLRNYPEFRFATPEVRESWVMVQGTKTGG
jgi:ribosomal protein L11 methyltransferase